MLVIFFLLFFEFFSPRVFFLFFFTSFFPHAPLSFSPLFSTESQPRRETASPPGTSTE